ncbi:MAG: sugar phosphate isomerase/epimerase [Bacteroidota bacterium]
MERRNFIKGLGITAASVALYSPCLSSYGRLPVKTPNFSLLLGTVEELMKTDPQGTLKKIAEIGFKGLEYPDTFGLPTSALKKIIADNHLYSLGGGYSMSELIKNFDTITTTYNEIGKKYVLCYWPWLDSGKNKTIENWKETCERFNDVGKRFKQAGLRLGYHNHDIEFIPTNNQIPYDTVLNYTDPEFVTIQMDIWWIYTGGQDPISFIERYPGRFELCHIKTKEILNNDAAVQKLNYKKILGHSKKAGFKEFILENEKGIAEPIDFIEKSYRYMKTLF